MNNTNGATIMDNETVKREIDQLYDKLNEMNEKFDKVLYALIGNELTKDGGIISRVISLEEKLKIAEAELRELKNTAAQNAKHLKWLWGVGGGAATVLTSSIIEILKNKFK